MFNWTEHKEELDRKGFSLIKSIFSQDERYKLKRLLEDEKKVFAIRQLVKKHPEILELIFTNNKFKRLYSSICDEGYFLSKAIYFNKPKRSNWFVNYHQDISISAKEKVFSKNFSQWTKKHGQFGVVAPKEILENTVTFRIHLDQTDETNGALTVIPKTHQKGVIRIDRNFDKSDFGNDVLCNVDEGGVMLMKPLLLHASQKSVSEFDRRVIHLEFCNQDIPMGWLEQHNLRKFLSF